MAVYHHPTLGPVTLVRSPRARRLGLSVRATGEVRLTLPYGGSETEALRFLEQKVEWVARTRSRLAMRYPHQPIEMPYATRSHELRLDPCDVTEPLCRIRGGNIVVRYPAVMRFDSDEIQTLIRRGIEEAWRLEAKEYLPRRVVELCERLGLRCGRVTVRNTRSRWGSCSSTDDISLSLHLMKLPDRLIDYIIIHELCHTRYKNHGEHFYQLLDRMTGGQNAALRSELKHYSTRWH